MNHFRYVVLIFFFTLFIVPAGSRTAAQEQASQIQYEIWVELDHEARMLKGRERITWRNDSQDEVQDIWLHLYWNAFKNEKSTVMQEAREVNLGLLGLRVDDGDWGWIDITDIRLSSGADLKASMVFINPDEPAHPGDQTVVRVFLPQSVPPGDEVDLELVFESKIPRGILRTGYYQDNYFIAQWFPKPGVYEEGEGWNCHEYHLSSEFFADFADFTVHITVPQNFVVGSSGKQTQAIADESEETVKYTFVQDRIHDFAWTADPDFIKIERDFTAERAVSPEEYEEIAGKLQISVEEVKLGDVRMILLIAPEHKGQVDRHFKALEAAIKYYGLWYGPYPYETVTMVDPPFRTGSGGMEYPTLFTAGTSILKSRDVLSPEGVIVHEFGHGYWYGLVANNEFEEAWLDEGINSYSEGKVTEKAYGPGAMGLSLNRIPLSWFIKMPKDHTHDVDRAAALQIVEFDPVVKDSWKFYSRGSYGLNVYMRAATCLYTLERLVGDDTMLRILRKFQTDYRFKHPTTRDFIDVVNRVTERDMTWFFEELFFSTNEFDYGLTVLNSIKKDTHARGVFDIEGRKEEITSDDIEELEEAEADKEIYRTTVVARRFGEARIHQDSPLKLKVVFEDETEEEVLWDGKDRWMKWVFDKPAKADYAFLDPDQIWLIDSDLANNNLTRKPSRGGILKMTSRLLFWVQNYLQLLAGLS